MKPKNEDLWKTMNERDIDPLVEQAIHSSSEFLAWWVNRCYQTVECPELINVKANHWREPESRSVQDGRQRENDLFVEFRGREAKHHAIIVESKIAAPFSSKQPEHYQAYRDWGVRSRKWASACTVLMAPKDYSGARSKKGKLFNHFFSYQDIAKIAGEAGFDELVNYLYAGVQRHAYVEEPRNPDEVVGGFRVKYSELLWDENQVLFNLLASRYKEKFDKSQKWMEFNLKGSQDQIIHKISNKRDAQVDSDPQCVALHLHGQPNNLDKLPDLGHEGEKEWSASPAHAIKEIHLPHDAWMFFKNFDETAALKVWEILEILLNFWSEWQSRQGKN